MMDAASHFPSPFRWYVSESLPEQLTIASVIGVLGGLVEVDQLDAVEAILTDIAAEDAELPPLLAVSMAGVIATLDAAAEIPDDLITLVKGFSSVAWDREKLIAWWKRQNPAALNRFIVSLARATIDAYAQHGSGNCPYPTCVIHRRRRALKARLN